MKKHNIVMVGAGFVGGLHSEAYSCLPEAKLVGVVDTRLEYAKKIAKQHGAKAFSSLDEALNSLKNVDVVDVCLPTELHKDAVLKAFNYGTDVIVEKPFAKEISDIDAMIEGSKKFNKKLMVAHVLRFMPAYSYIKKIVDRKVYGKPVYFTAWRIWNTPDWSWNDWITSMEKSGGTLLDLSIHDIDIANWLLGKPTSLFAQESYLPGKNFGPSHVTSCITYDSGVKATIEAGHLMPRAYPFTFGFRLVLENAAVEHLFIDGKSELYLIDDSGRKDIQESELDSVPNGNSYAQEIRHFLENRNGDRGFIVTLEDAKLAVSTVHSLRKSIRENCVVKNEL